MNDRPAIRNLDAEKNPSKEKYGPLDKIALKLILIEQNLLWVPLLVRFPDGIGKQGSSTGSHH